MKRGIVAVLILGLAALLPAQEYLFETRGSLTQNEREHTYRLALERGIAVEVLVQSDEFDSFVRALLPDGRLRSNDDYDRLNAGFQATIVQDGEMRLTVSSVFPGEEGAYRITVRQIPVPQPILPGETIRGSIGKNDDVDGMLVRRYRLNGESGTRVVIDVTSDDFDPFLETRDQNGRVLRNDDGGETEFGSRVSYQFEDSGFLILTVRGLFGSDLGDYEISVRQASRDVLAEFDGELTRTDERGYDGTVLDRYEWEARRGDELSVFLESAEFDTVVYVSDPLGRTLGRDDDSGGDDDSLITLSIPMNGVYAIYVTSFDGMALGAYRLTLFGETTRDR